MDLSPDELGTLALCSVRYACGRRTYMPSLVARIVRRIWPMLEPRDRQTIRLDIAEQIARGDAGDDCDVREWQQLLAATTPDAQGGGA
ncbi:MAG: hypothetical protein K2R93_12250 [Gemmatimonadaceae bacterium]|nr:hypothetical protein [Gemmatimonadaceae bacterium]